MSDDFTDVEQWVRAAQDERFEEPPARVWDAIRGEIGVGTPAFEPPAADVNQEAATDVTEPSTDAPSSAGVSRRTLLGWGIAAAVGLAGGAAAVAAWPRPATVISEVELRSLDNAQRVLGAAAIVETDDGLFLRITLDEGVRPTGDYTEVWLISTDLKRMISVGVWTRRSGELFPVTRDVLGDGFVVADVSNERFDGVVTHSGDSIARGALPW